MLDVNEAALQAASRFLQLMAVRADMADEHQIEKAVSAAATRLAGLDGVVNCAGIDLPRPVERLQSDYHSRRNTFFRSLLT